MKRLLILIVGIFLMGFWSLEAPAINFIEDPLTAANGSVVFSGGAGTQADPYIINEELTGFNYYVKIEGLPGSRNPANTAHSTGFWLKKVVTNSTGVAWTSFENEVHEILGTPSSDGDGLSFAQGFSPRPFSSDKFLSWTEEILDKDFVNFFNGTVGIGETVTMYMIITDNSPIDPFWLRERPNEPVPGVPEPGTMILLGSGLLGLAGFARKRMKK